MLIVGLGWRDASVLEGRAATAKGTNISQDSMTFCKPRGV